MKRIMFALLALTTFTSCNHYFYIPGTQNVPLFHQKNEFFASGSTGGGEEINCIDFQAAYSITDKYAVMVNYMSADGSGSSSSAKGNYLEGAFGYYRTIGQRFVFEVYGGVGGSSQKHEFEFADSTINSTPPFIVDGNAELNFYKLFLQPSIGVSYNWLDLAFTSSISRVQFTKVDHESNELFSELSAVDQIEQNNVSYLWEPGFTARVGWKYVKLQAQYTAVQQLSKPKLEFEDYKFTLGVSLNISSRFKKKESVSN